MLRQAAVPILDSTASHSRGAKARSNWWYKAKHFIIRVSGMYDVGDNANGTFQKTMPMPVW